jgi:hypothetical protein
MVARARRIEWWALFLAVAEAIRQQEIDDFVAPVDG